MVIYTFCGDKKLMQIAQKRVPQVLKVYCFIYFTFADRLMVSMID
jgi:hypothetical protein